MPLYCPHPGCGSERVDRVAKPIEPEKVQERQKRYKESKKAFDVAISDWDENYEDLVRQHNSLIGKLKKVTDKKIKKSHEKDIKKLVEEMDTLEQEKPNAPRKPSQRKSKIYICKDCGGYMSAWKVTTWKCMSHEGKEKPSDKVCKACDVKRGKAGCTEQKFTKTITKIANKPQGKRYRKSPHKLTRSFSPRRVVYGENQTLIHGKPAYHKLRLLMSGRYDAYNAVPSDYNPSSDTLILHPKWETVQKGKVKKDQKFFVTVKAESIDEMREILDYLKRVGLKLKVPDNLKYVNLTPQMLFEKLEEHVGWRFDRTMKAFIIDKDTTLTFVSEKGKEEIEVKKGVLYLTQIPYEQFVEE